MISFGIILFVVGAVGTFYAIHRSNLKMEMERMEDESTGGM